VTTTSAESQTITLRPYQVEAVNAVYDHLRRRDDNPCVVIGCQQTGRQAYLMELDPLYCDVIVQRWEQFTGQKAQRVPADAPAEAAA